MVEKRLCAFHCATVSKALSLTLWGTKQATVMEDVKLAWPVAVYKHNFNFACNLGNKGHLCY